MKKTMIPVLGLFIVAGFIACKKNGANDNNSYHNAALVASKTTAIQQGEPVLFTLDNVTDSVRWSVIPAANVQINSQGNKATILFGKAGSYEVKAMSGNLQASQKVNVADSAHLPDSANYRQASLLGDQLQLTISRIDSGSYSGLRIAARTKNSYNCLNSSLVSNLTTTGGDYSIRFSGIHIPSGDSCTAGQAKATSFNYLFPVADGRHVFNVILNDSTYTGSIVKKDSSYTISWPYSNGVTVSPLVIK